MAAQDEGRYLLDLELGLRDWKLQLLLGADTLVGPVLLGYGWAEGGHDRLYLTVGRSF